MSISHVPGDSPALAGHGSVTVASAGAVSAVSASEQANGVGAAAGDSPCQPQPAAGLLYVPKSAAQLADVREQVSGGGFPSADLVDAAAGLFGGQTVPKRRDGRRFWVQVAAGTVALCSTGNTPPFGDVTARGEVHGWSAASRRRMMRTFAELDFAPMEQLDGIPAMVTLTLPGDWVTVAPTAASFKRHFLTWRKRYARTWGTAWTGLWKLEFQRRGAPHLHLYQVVPRGTVAIPGDAAADFRRWLGWSWADVVAHPDPDERRRHRLAGTGIDLIAGMKASDPKRLAVYFSKHSSPASGERNPKEYQHQVPPEWAARPGRFWGYIGLEKRVATTELSTEDFIRARRLLRRWSRAQTSYPLTGEPTTRPRVAKVVVRRGDSLRKVTRRRLLMDQGQMVGGFTMTNSGAVLGGKIARALDIWRE